MKPSCVDLVRESRYWEVTQNNVEAFNHWRRDDGSYDLDGALTAACISDIIGIAGQLETAPTTGHVHFQGIIRLCRARKWLWVKKHLPTFFAGAHFSQCNSKYLEYCCKEETRLQGPWVVGKWVINQVEYKSIRFDLK